MFNAQGELTQPVIPIMMIKDNMMKLHTLLKTATIASSLALSSFAFSADIDMSADKNDLAIQGYDPIAYFTDSKPTQGNTQYSATYKNAIYHFVSAENRDAFRSDPTKYAPQYGGYCAMGVSLNKKLDTDPTAWRIVDNKLYLNLNKDVQKRWLEDVPGNIVIAEEVWPTIKLVSADVVNAE